MREIKFRAWDGKKMDFDVSSVTTGNTRTMTVPDRDITLGDIPIMIVQDQKSSGTNGGSSIAGTQTRTLNTVVQNDITGASLSSDQITLPAGKYYIIASTGAYTVARHKSKIVRISGESFSTMYGQNGYNGTGDLVTTFSQVQGYLDLSSSTVLEVQHYTATEKAANGLGLAISQGTEVYTTITIQQVG